MKVSIFGLGYVGCVSAACMAQDGHYVIGVDINPSKVAQMRAGISPIVELGLNEAIAKQVDMRRLNVTLDGGWAVANSAVSLVCVGTPSRPNGSLDVSYVEQVCREIGMALRHKPTYHTIVIRSTVLPTTVRDVMLPLLESVSGKEVGLDFGLVMNPEFLREGSALRDYYDPGVIVIGEVDERSGDVVEQLYRNVDASVIHTSLESAEMIKYANNAFHGLKVAFANEIGNLCKAHGVDGQHVMDIVCRDNRLNISPAYLRPGFAFGGSCLPKDLRAITYRAREKDQETPVLSAILPSNQQQVARGIRMVQEAGKQRVGVFGLSFKPNTDDLRESPVIPLVETLLGRGYDVTIFDETVCTERLMGSNKAYVEKKLPHIARMLRPTVKSVLDECEVVVITNGARSYRNIAANVRDDQTVIDFVGIDRPQTAQYEGICW